MTHKYYKEEFQNIKNYFGLEFLGDISKKNTLNTKWGVYHFWFDKDSIFGKFENLQKDKIPEKFQVCKDVLYKVNHLPNIYSGKMNFHFDQIFDFIDTLDRIKED